MRFAFIRHESLPRLAWCAHLRRNDEVVEIHHGPWVETFASGFVEGAWNGPFNTAGMVEADHLIGTAGRAERDRIVLCSPTNLADRIYTVHVGDAVYASNSMAFLLQMSGDAADPLYLRYVKDRLQQQYVGVTRSAKTLPTARGRRIAVHDYCNLSIDPGLSLRRTEKPETSAPCDYEDYVGRLAQTIAAVASNAADPLRTHRYRPVATLSQGYDCNALAALLSRHGGREAITFGPFDDGTSLGEKLGYTVTRYDRLGFLGRGGVEAEFLAVPWGTDVVMAACEEQLAGALLLTGRPGDLLLKTGSPAAPNLSGARINALAGASLTEFRLRVGFLQFPPLYYGALHPDAIYRISVSPAMARWSIGGDYDRPIARRIVEEAGVSRELFGQQKAAGAYFLVRQPDEMSAESRADFRAFLRTMPWVSRRRWGPRPFRHVALALGARVLRRYPKVRAAMGIRPLAPTLEMERLFHWAAARVSKRYRLP
jgi:hypothetical protein